MKHEMDGCNGRSNMGIVCQVTMQLVTLHIITLYVKKTIHQFKVAFSTPVN